MLHTYSASKYDQFRKEVYGDAEQSISKDIETSGYGISFLSEDAYGIFDEPAWRFGQSSFNLYSETKREQVGNANHDQDIKRKWKLVRQRIKNNQTIYVQGLCKEICLLALSFINDEKDALDTLKDCENCQPLSAEKVQRQRMRDMMTEAAWQHIDDNIPCYVKSIEENILPQFSGVGIEMLREALESAKKDYQEARRSG
ncbi:hypothetical protein K402DRAFT_426249 [Aulographum hederae CBS 113979]|uniref:Uncharacterized protein n=1 Tax=Aulographum hederae CBS 113979 TaxID=1176131 RepID=A0A6G1HGK8_9PEZI|nr:hypothetical protein K402DRAFT_426249 [Aulographum hederae CBS 113979]